MHQNSSYFKVSSNHPVDQCNWIEAIKFCNNLSIIKNLTPVYTLNTWEIDREADGFRLPTEAEWEYACRAGTTTRCYWGDDLNYDDIDHHAWFSDNSEGATHEVGLKLPNPWSLFDMHGNIWEWCYDWYGSYKKDSRIDPHGPSRGLFRVLRGGDWFNFAKCSRSAFRIDISPEYCVNFTGLRLVKSCP